MMYGLRIVCLAGLFSVSVQANQALAQAPTGKVTVVTSFSKDVTDPFKKSFEKDRKSTRLNSSHIQKSRMPSSA